MGSEETDKHKRLREELARQAEDSAERQHKRGKLSAQERLEALLDPGSFIELDPFVEHRVSALGMDGRRRLGDGVVTGHGTVDGRTVFVYSQDFGFMGGSLGEAHARKICHVFDLALENGAPIIGFHDSGGARIQEGVASLAGYGEIFRRNVVASGVVPQIAVIAGPTAGGASYSPALMDFTLMVRGVSTTFITGPRVIKQVTGEEVEPQRLGSADTHASITGIATLALDSEETVFETIRRLLGYLPSNNLDDPPSYEATAPSAAIEGVIPADSRKAAASSSCSPSTP
jgi:acetyl-CoA carboxylase carboxyltransferase component